MEVRFWGARGSVPVPNRAMLGHGGNTSCVEITLEDGTEIILDAGTGIRELAAAPRDGSGKVQLLLTHLHLDHIQGLLFFPPLFDPEREITVYGPPGVGADLQNRLGRYLSAPLSPLDLRELPAQVGFAACPYETWEVGSATIRGAIVTHRGVTLGYRISEGDRTVCYIPDHEPALGAALESADVGWISGTGLAAGASLLIHDGQYTDTEYADHIGWGHSAISDTVRFGLRAEVERLAVFHHDPAHDDSTLDELSEQAQGLWTAAGRDAGEVCLAREGMTITV
jgi:phosphoribosyl 1,2-cyclic phosphodiesterase